MAPIAKGSEDETRKQALALETSVSLEGAQQTTCFEMGARMTTRALEAGARAAHHATPRNKPYDKLTLFKKNLYRTEATAAITAYLVQAGKEGWVMVPKDATDQMAVAGGIDCEGIIFGGAGNYPTIFDAMKKVYRTMIANRPLAAAQNGGE